MPSPPRQSPEVRPWLGARLRSWCRSRAVRLALLGAVAIGSALALSAALTLSHALSPTAFAGMAGEGFGRAIQVEAVAFSLHGQRGRPRLQIRGLEIEGLGTAAAAEIELRIRPLLRGKVRIRTVRLEDPRLVLYRGPGGDFLPIFAPTGSGADLSHFPAFEANGGEIRIVQGEKLTAILRITSLNLSRFDALRTAKLVLAGNLTGGDGRWHTHPLQLRGDLVQEPGRTTFENGRARARHVGANWWVGRDARAHFAYREGRIEIESLDVRGFEGSWHVDGLVWLRGGMRLDLAARAEGVHFASLLSAADGRGPESDADLGVLRMRWTSLRVPWRSGPRFEEGEGEGSLRVVGGELPGRSGLGSLVGLEPAPTPVEVFEAPVALREARLHTDGMRLVTGDYVLEAAGSVGLDRSVALEGHADLIGSLIVPMGATMLPTVPVTIAGDLPWPRVDSHVSRLPVNGLGAVAGMVQKAGSSVAEGTKAAGRRIGQTLGAAGKKVGSGLGAVGRGVSGVFGTSDPPADPEPEPER